MSSAIQGQLGEDVLANLMQYLAFNRANGCLRLQGNKRLSGEIFFEEGNAVHVITGAYRDVEALAVLLTWVEGSFGFYANVPAPQRSMNESVDRLLLQASYQVDVNNLVQESDLDAQSVLVPITDDADKTSVKLTVHAIQLLRHIDARNTLRDIAQQMAWPEEQVLQVARELLEQDMVDIAEDPGLERVLDVWGTALQRLEHYLNQRKPESFQRAWSKVGNLLADEFPCLDPFAPDLRYRQGELTLESDDLDLDEVTDALLAAVQEIAQLHDLDPQALRDVLQKDQPKLAYPRLLEVSGLAWLLRL